MQTPVSSFNPELHWFWPDAPHVMFRYQGHISKSEITNGIKKFRINPSPRKIPYNCREADLRAGASSFETTTSNITKIAITVVNVVSSNEISLSSIFPAQAISSEPAHRDSHPEIAAPLLGPKPSIPFAMKKAISSAIARSNGNPNVTRNVVTLCYLSLPCSDPTFTQISDSPASSKIRTLYR